MVGADETTELWLLSFQALFDTKTSSWSKLIAFASFQDHMRPQDWDPKTFFAMHDLNGDKYWDEDEVRVSL